MGVEKVKPIRPAITKRDRQALIDEFGALQNQVERFKPTRDRYEETRKTIVSWYEKAPGAQPFLEEGTQFMLKVSACTNERTVKSMPKLFRILGLETFLKLCKFPLAAVDAAVPKMRHAEFLVESQTGPRKIEAVPKTASERFAA
jgi:hypothetical protein